MNNEGGHGLQHKPQRHGGWGQSSRRRVMWIVAGTGLLVLGIAGGFRMLNRPSAAANMSHAIIQAQKAVNFTVYFPERTPVGFSCKSNSISADSHAVLYACIYDKNKAISVSVQARDPHVTAEQFRPTSEFMTHIGRAYVVDLEDRTTAAVLGKNSWVLLNAPETIALEDMRGLIDSLRPVPH